MFEKEIPMRNMRATELHPRVLSHESFLEEMSRPASRFKTPLSLPERVRLFIAGRVAHLLPTSRAPLFVQTGVPLNWQVIINYLYREGILESPNIAHAAFRNDKPMSSEISLIGHFDRRATDAPMHRISGHGNSTDVHERFSKAVGELLERYFGARYKRSQMPQASMQSMTKSGRAFLAPRDCSKFAPWQMERFPGFRFGESTLFRWVETQELIGGTQALVPAQLMFWLYDRQTEKEPLLCPITSNGLAGHFSREEAIIAAIHEYVQRDAFLIYWMNTLSPRIIAIEECDDPAVRERLRYLARLNVRPYFLNVTTDLGMPTSVCMLVQNEETDPTISVGAATGTSAAQAFLNASTEAMAAQSIAANDLNVEPFDVDRNIPFTRSDITILERTSLWRGREMYEHVKFFISGSRQPFVDFERLFVSYSSPKHELQAIIEHFRALGPGYEIYVYESRHRVLRTLNYHVVKVFIPKLVPLHMNEHEAALAAERLRTVPQRLHYQDPKLNVFPHPFP